MNQKQWKHTIYAVNQNKYPMLWLFWEDVLNKTFRHSTICLGYVMKLNVINPAGGDGEYYLVPITSMSWFIA